jgi:hypothetical protein
MPSTKAIVVMTSKYTSARTRPANLREIPGSGDPVHDDAKHDHGTSILMSLMKPSPSGFI